MSKSRRCRKSRLFDPLLSAGAVFLLHVFSLMPLLFAHVIARCTFFVLYPIADYLGISRRYVKNISFAFEGDFTANEVQKISKRTIYYWWVNIFEILHFYHGRSYKSIEKYVDVEGIEKIQRAKKDGIGAIGLTAHFGNFPLMILRLAREELKQSHLFTKFRPDWLGSLFVKYKQALGLKMILTKGAGSPTQAVIDDLENGGFVLFVADEYKKSGGVEVTFFDKPTLQAIGPSIVSLKTGAPILPVFILRERGRFRVVVEDPIEIEPSGDTDKDIAFLTQKRMDIIEKYIRRYPDQWLWVHSRWNTK